MNRHKLCIKNKVTYFIIHKTAFITINTQTQFSKILRKQPIVGPSFSAKSEIFAGQSVK